MPLSKARDRERKRLERARLVQPKSNLTVRPSVQPKEAIKSIPGLVMRGNRILGIEEQPSKIPLYDPMKHRAGDRVLMQSPYSKRLVETTIPELDADGQPI